MRQEVASDPGLVSLQGLMGPPGQQGPSGPPGDPGDRVSEKGLSHYDCAACGLNLVYSST